MLTIDGSLGEGGGQVLRTSLSLSLVTGKAFRIINIRSRRQKPGLMQQHLTSVNAARDICRAGVSGNFKGSLELKFIPGPVRAGKYRFAVGTAGSATLVLQTILPPLLTADDKSHLVLEGGTHNPLAPPFDFLDQVFLPLISRMGPEVSARLHRHGFYPAGGGKFSVDITPCPKLKGLEIAERGEIRQMEARALVANLPATICERELQVLLKKLPLASNEIRAEEVPSDGPGNYVQLKICSEHITELFAAFGQKGITAERVASSLAKEANRYLDADAPVGPHLADQLLLPLAMAGNGSFCTTEPTTHTMTNIEVIKHFLDVAVAIETKEDRRPRTIIRIVS